MNHLLAVSLAAVIGGRVCAQPEDPFWIAAADASSAMTPQNVVQAWPERAQTIAKAMIEKYGLPHQYNDSALAWTNNGPWRKTVIRRSGVLEQTIGYEVSADAVADLRRFDKRLKVDLAKHQMSASSESEQLNFLAFNLADEIARGNRTVRSARAFYDKTVRLANAGKTSRYMSGFLFKGHRLMNETYYP
ncbi:MAG: hypothetical protein ACHQ2Z_14560 [Elusimicrobiota bacterium]